MLFILSHSFISYFLKEKKNYNGNIHEDDDNNNNNLCFFSISSIKKEFKKNEKYRKLKPFLIFDIQNPLKVIGK